MAVILKILLLLCCFALLPTYSSFHFIAISISLFNHILFMSILLWFRGLSLHLREPFELAATESNQWWLLWKIVFLLLLEELWAHMVHTNSLQYQLSSHFASFLTPLKRTNCILFLILPWWCLWFFVLWYLPCFALLNCEKLPLFFLL